MPLDFPSSPTDGQTYNGYVYSTSVGAWQAKPSAQSPFYTSDTPPSNPVVGDSWFNTNDGTMYIYVNDGTSSQWVEHRSEIARSQVGLVPIVPTSISVSSGTGSVSASGMVTFTGATGVSLNGVFTSAYRNYRIYAEVPVASGVGSLTVRFRSAGSDNTANIYYQWWFLSRLNGTTQTNTGGPNTSYSLLNFPGGSSGFYSWTGDITTPQIADKQTTIVGMGMGQDATNSYQVMSSIVHNTTASFDGITLFTGNSSTFNGNVKIYGYN